MTKLRKILPPFAQVKGLRVNTDKLIGELAMFGLFDGPMTAASAEHDEPENLFIKANMVCKQFFNAHDEAAYTEVNLSKPSYGSLAVSENDLLRDKNAVYRTKRLDPSRPEYSEHADERKHDIDPKYLHDGSELQKVFAWFRGKPCRVRIARMKARTNIKPHVDYDPSYVFRYHIPLMTNERATLHAQQMPAREATSLVSIAQTHTVHFPADGRIFWINTGVMHWASNDGDTDRYHLLIDVTGDGEVDNINQLESL